MVAVATKGQWGQSRIFDNLLMSITPVVWSDRFGSSLLMSDPR